MVNEKDIFRKAIDCFGEEAQLGMVTEELAELIVSINHELRRRENSIIEELADVYIVLEQLQIILASRLNRTEIEIETELKIFIQTKMERLANKVNTYDYAKD